jgi:hypothetical protein
MACARNTNYQNSKGEQPNTTISRKLKYHRGYPAFKPIIYSLSINGSDTGKFATVSINGKNFLPPPYGTTYVNFGEYQGIPITFYSSSNISFVIPLNANSGNYTVIVVNIYNNNFSPSSREGGGGVINYSNSVIYTLN